MASVFGGLDPAVYIGDMSKDTKAGGKTPMLAAVLGHAQAAFGKPDIFRIPDKPKPTNGADKERRQSVAPQPEPPAQREASLFGPQTSAQAMEVYMPAAMPPAAREMTEPPQDVQGLMAQLQQR